ncbi:MAG: hypothetical protein Q8P11_00950 [bacterium]|nr:hypothetical protein [bacterium]
MAKKTSGYLKLFGKIFEVVKIIFNDILDEGGTDDHIDAYLKDTDRRKKVAQIIVGSLNEISKKVDNSGLIIVDNNKSFSDQIKIVNFYYVNSHINEKTFPIDPAVGVEMLKVRILDLGKISTEDAEKKIEEKGLIKATPARILQYAINNPDEQLKYPIVCLMGIEIRDGRGVLCAPVLDGLNDWRLLGLHGLAGDWSGNYRFLAFEQVSSEGT